MPESVSKLEFGNGEEDGTIKITILSDDKEEEPEVFTVTLYHPPDLDPTKCSGKIGQPGIAYVTVHDATTSELSFSYIMLNLT